MPLTRAAEQIAAQSTTALIVEDDATMRTLLTSLTLQLGFKTVAGFSRPEPALERLEYDTFGLGIIDLNLGDCDGASLIAAIRANPRARTNAMPVLVASTAATGNRIQSAIAAGADGFLCKPFSVTNLKRQIEFARKKAHARRLGGLRSRADSRLDRLPTDFLELD